MVGAQRSSLLIACLFSDIGSTVINLEYEENPIGSLRRVKK